MTKPDNSKAPMVSVIIPTYNGLPYLKQAVESVLAQTHKDFILYIVDDGSTDKGATEKYVKALGDPRVRYLRKKNGGQSTARNYAIKISTSPFIAFIDADDVWRPNKLKRQLALFTNRPELGLAYGFCKLIDANNKQIGEVVYKKRGYLFKHLLGGNRIAGSASMVLVRREVFDKVGTFRSDFKVGDDWDMWLRIAKDYQIDYVPEYLAELRVLDNGMQQNRLKAAQDLEYMFPAMVKSFKLGAFDRSIVARACLKPACFMYFDVQDKAAARRVFLNLLRYNPLAVLRSNSKQWQIYLRILLGNKWLRSIRRRLSAKYRKRENDLKGSHE
jgi:glycosyltransferase involved in cell wall biosynthesis